MRLFEFDLKNEDPRKVFGKILFGDWWNFPEEDTEDEEYIFGMVKDYVNNSDRLPENLIKALRYMVKHRDAFPEFLKPQAKEVYRGLFLPHDVAEHYKDKQVPYTPQREIESWTTDYQMAVNFANNDFGSVIGAHDTSSRVPVVIAAKVDDSFIFNTTLTNSLSQFHHSTNEDEIIRVGSQPIQVTVIED